MFRQRCQARMLLSPEMDARGIPESAVRVKEHSGPGRGTRTQDLAIGVAGPLFGTAAGGHNVLSETSTTPTTIGLSTTTRPLCEEFRH